LRQLLAAHEEIAATLDDPQWRQNEQGQQIRVVFETIEKVMKAAPAKQPERKRIGFPLSRASGAVSLA
jgi:hypothetical protein